jgi:dephospho-CoA kinase
VNIELNMARSVFVIRLDFSLIYDCEIWQGMCSRKKVMKVIGVVGLNGSGKDEVVKYLNRQYGVNLISVGDLVREIAGREGVEPTRENLDEITRKYFTRYGRGYFLKLVVEKIRQNRWEFTGISGIRSPEDVKVLEEAFKNMFILISVNITDAQVRYARMKKRGSQRDNMTYEDFQKQDQVSEDLFRVHEVMMLAQISVANDGPLEDLHRKIDDLVKNAGLMN